MGLMTAGGGLSTSKLKETTAQPGDVVLNKTFYSGDKEKKTGTFNLGAANAGTGDVLSGKKFYSGNTSIKTGTMTSQGSYTSAASVARGGDTCYVRIPRGAYLSNGGSGYPEITFPYSSIIGTATFDASGDYNGGRTFTALGEVICAGAYYFDGDGYITISWSGNQIRALEHANSGYKTFRIQYAYYK